jgi:hypothetical protein
MLKSTLIDYAAPIAVSLTLAVGGMAVNTSEKVAVLQSETKNMVQVQQEMVQEMKELNRIVYQIDAKLEVQHE